MQVKPIPPPVLLGHSLLLLSHSSNPLSSSLSLLSLARLLKFLWHTFMNYPSPLSFSCPFVCCWGNAARLPSLPTASIFHGTNANVVCGKNIEEANSGGKVIKNTPELPPPPPPASHRRPCSCPSSNNEHVRSSVSRHGCMWLCIVRKDKGESLGEPRIAHKKQESSAFLCQLFIHNSFR